MAARVIEALQAYLGSLYPATAAPLTRLTNEQARTICETLSEVDRLHVGLRQKVQTIQRTKKRKVEILLNRTPSHCIIRANLRRIYGSKSGEAASQNASSLRNAHSMVVWQWIRTIPTKDWDNGAMSADVRSLVVARMAETKEASVLMPEELEVMGKMSKGELKESTEYLEFYNKILHLYCQQRSGIQNVLNISTQQVPQPSSLQNDTSAATVQGQTSFKRKRLQSAWDTGYHSIHREDDNGYNSGDNTAYHATRQEEDIWYRSSNDRFAITASSQRGQTVGLLDDKERQIELVYTNGPVENISFLGEPIATAVERSGQRDLERAMCAICTDCISVLVPKGVTEDISLNIWMNRELGFKLVEFLGLTLQKTPRL